MTGQEGLLDGGQGVGIISTGLAILLIVIAILLLIVALLFSFSSQAKGDCGAIGRPVSLCFHPFLQAPQGFR